MSASGIGGFDVNAAEPSSPSSSPDQKLKTRFRRRCSFENASAMPSTAAVPEALSSAPPCMRPASSLDASDRPLAPWPEMVVVRAEGDPRLRTWRAGVAGR